jgi:cytochrome d ubiquinol oxidase subunit II
MKWWRKMWDISYSISSILLAFLLGVVLGNILQGIAIGENYYYYGKGFFEFLNPFSILTGITTLALFMVHGAIYLLMKTEGRLFAKLSILVKKAIIFFIVLFSLLSIYTLFYIPHLSDRFQSNPIYFILPILTFLSIANIPRLVSKRRFRMAFLFTSLTISFSLMMVALELYPVLLLSTISPEYSLTVYNSAASDKSIGIMLGFVAIGVPLVLSYTIFVYKTFRGKVQLDETSY